MSDFPQASVIICAYNGKDYLEPCLRSVLASRGVAFEVIVIDNASHDGSGGLVEKVFPQCILIRSAENLGFAGGNNLAIRAARAPFLVLLNQDTEVPPDWLAQLIAPFERDEKIGVVGCKLRYPDGKIQHAGGVVWPNGNTDHLGVNEADEGQWNEPGKRDYVTGAAMALRRATLEAVGLIDEGFWPAYFEELDWQMRIKAAGWHVHYEPTDGVIHHESKTLGVGSPRFVELYTRHRLRNVALNGTNMGKREALRWERRWVIDMWRNGRLWPVLKAYGWAIVHWWRWRSERTNRPQVPKLAPLKK